MIPRRGTASQVVRRRPGGLRAHLSDLRPPTRPPADNGVPFAITGIHRLSQLNVWWMRLPLRTQRGAAFARPSTVVHPLLATVLHPGPIRAAPPLEHPVDFMSNASRTPARFVSVGACCSSRTPSNSTPSVWKNSLTASGRSTSAPSYSGGWTNVPSTFGSNPTVLPMFPVAHWLARKLPRFRPALFGALLA